MPKLGLTMEEGTITEWLVADGADVGADSVVLRISTDKTETDVETPAAGALHITGEVGETYSCGEQIGWLLDAGETVPAGATVAPTSTPGSPSAPQPTSPAASAGSPAAATPTAPHHSGGRIVASPNARRIAREKGLNLALVHGTGPGRRIVAGDLDGLAAGSAASIAPPSAGNLASGITAPSTFAARALADLLGVDISTVAPDPRMGRVSRDGVAAHVRQLLANAAASASPAAPAATAPPEPAALPPALQEPTSVIALRGMRGTIASRMHASLQDMAQLSLFMDADLDAVIADRASRKQAGSAPSYTDYVIAAAARALAEHPGVNAQVTNDGIALLPDIHVGMAVALDDGLVVPVITNTSARSLSDLSTETSRLAEAARGGALQLSDLEGGTFSVSTLGMFGVDGFTPVINPPNAAILGVGRLRDELVLDGDGTVGSVTRLTLSLTWDHRVFDGAPAAAFTRRIVELLQDPAALDATS